MFKFVRRVKLTEHFKDRSQAAPDSIEDDRDDTGWMKEKPDWFPSYVRENRSADLVNFVDQILSDTPNSLLSPQEKFWNNLSVDHKK